MAPHHRRQRSVIESCLKNFKENYLSWKRSYARYRGYQQHPSHQQQQQQQHQSRSYQSRIIDSPQPNRDRYVQSSSAKSTRIFYKDEYRDHDPKVLQNQNNQNYPDRSFENQTTAINHNDNTGIDNSGKQEQRRFQGIIGSSYPNNRDLVTAALSNNHNKSSSEIKEETQNTLETYQEQQTYLHVEPEHEHPSRPTQSFTPNKIPKRVGQRGRPKGSKNKPKGIGSGFGPSTPNNNIQNFNKKDFCENENSFGQNDGMIEETSLDSIPDFYTPNDIYERTDGLVESEVPKVEDAEGRELLKLRAGGFGLLSTSWIYFYM